jgi:hypothetical protein
MNGFPSPLGGEGKGEGEMILSSPPPQSSPIKGEESILENRIPGSSAGYFTLPLIRIKKYIRNISTTSPFSGRFAVSRVPYGERRVEGNGTKNSLSKNPASHEEFEL